VAKLADAQDLKSWVSEETYRFNSGPGHHFIFAPRNLGSRSYFKPRGGHPSSDNKEVEMESEIKVGQRFKFNLSSDDSAQERLAVVTNVLSNREEGLGPEVDFYLAYWVEANELSEAEVSKALVFERGIDGNVYLDGCQVSITLLT
jgi:hypothetical protein